MIIRIRIDSKLHIRKIGLPPIILRQIKKELTTTSPQYLRFIKSGRHPKWRDPGIQHYQDHPGWLSIPRGYINRIQEILKPIRPEYDVDDQTLLFQSNFDIEMKEMESGWEFQDEAIIEISKNPFSVLVFPTGAGKTVTAIKMICQRKQPTLIVVHTKTLLHQWKTTILEYTNIEEDEIGLVGDGKIEIKPITIGIINSLVKITGQLKDKFGQLIIDECHRTPARTFSEVASSINSYYVLGLTATPKRSDGQSKMINFYCGDTAVNMEPREIQKRGKIMKPELIIRETQFISLLEKSANKIKNSLIIKGIDNKENTTINFIDLLEEIVNDSKRNTLITNDIIHFINNNKGIALVISDRITHCENLKSLVSEKTKKVELLTSKTKNQKEILEKASNGKIRVLIATSQLIGEGFDCPNLSSIFLTTPISSQYRLIQYVGRILRIKKGKESAFVYDYVDVNSRYCMKMLNRRFPGYRKMGANV